MYKKNVSSMYITVFLISKTIHDNNIIIVYKMIRLAVENSI